MRWGGCFQCGGCRTQVREGAPPSAFYVVGICGELSAAWGSFQQWGALALLGLDPQSSPSPFPPRVSRQLSHRWDSCNLGAGCVHAVQTPPAPRPSARAPFPGVSQLFSPGSPSSRSPPSSLQAVSAAWPWRGLRPGVPQVKQRVKGLVSCAHGASVTWAARVTPALLSRAEDKDFQPNASGLGLFPSQGICT